jgi:hypothetical protein
VVNPARGNEKPGSPLVLRAEEEYIKSCTDTEDDWSKDLHECKNDTKDIFVDWPDTILKLVAAEDIIDTSTSWRQTEILGINA